MRKLFATALFPLVVASCPKPPTPPAVITPSVQLVNFDLKGCNDAIVKNYCNGPSLAQFTITPLDVQQPARVQAGDGNGYVFVDRIPATWAHVSIDIVADGYAPYHTTAALADLLKTNSQCDSGDCDHNFYSLKAIHVDPSNVPLSQLAAIRGAMWPNASACPGLLLPFGPRPGQPDNIIATDFFANYSSSEQLAIVNCLRSRGFTHVVMGPIVDAGGYHGQYAPHDWHWEDAAHLTGDNFDKFLDIAQYFWDHQLTPIVFVHPDGWTLDETTSAFTSLLQLPRAQKLIRIVVPTGWEPTRYDWSSCTWAGFAQWARQTLPNALVLLHTVNDVDAPAGTDSLCDDNGKPNGEAWARVAPFVHGWLIQNGAYKTAPDADPVLARNFASQFMANGDGASLHGPRWHFVNGISGWPTTSAWGNQPIRLYAGETTSFEGYWSNMPEAWRVAWGDLAMRSGADGYLDGGTVAVPVR